MWFSTAVQKLSFTAVIYKVYPDFLGFSRNIELGNTSKYQLLLPMVENDEPGQLLGFIYCMSCLTELQWRQEEIRLVKKRNWNLVYGRIFLLVRFHSQQFPTG